MKNTLNARNIRPLLLVGLLVALVLAFSLALTVTADAHTHTYNGAPMPLDKVYTPDELPTVFGGAPDSCLDESGNGAFVCDTCNERILVKVRGACQYGDDDVIEFVDSTCSQVGHKTYECGVCEQERTEIIPRKSHTYTGGPVTATHAGDVLTLIFECDLCSSPVPVTGTTWSVESETPTCARPYTDTYTYTYIDQNGISQSGTLAVTHTLSHYYDNGEKVEIDLDHVYTLSELKQIFGNSLTGLVTYGNAFATCSTAGSVAFTCSGCGDRYLFAAIGDHNWGDWGEKPADCLNASCSYRECQAAGCDAREEVAGETPALGHDKILNEAKAPSCTEVGWEAYISCSRCDYSTYKEIPAGHDEISHEAKDPSCTEVGWDAYVSCSRCDYTTYEEQGVLGHDEQSHAAQTPTCTQIGWDAYVTCSRCDYTTYVELPMAHAEIAHEAKTPTCTQVGWDAYVTCSHCDYTTYVELPAGHDEQSHTAKAPTCTEVGWDAYVTCSRCDYTTYVELPAGHDEQPHEAKAPTCTEGGWDAYVTCSRCDYTTYTERAKLDHDIVEHEAKAPTHDEAGWDAYESCSRCDYTTYHELPPLTGEPSAESDGYIESVISFLVVIVGSLGLTFLFACAPKKYRQ